VREMIDYERTKEMKDNYTDIILVLDRSGSMDAVRADTIGGVNRFIEEQQKVPGEARWSLFQFDTEYDRLADAVEMQEAKPLDEKTFVPRGNTCLYGAIGRAIGDTGERLKGMREEERPGRVVFVIVTDGQENSSHLHEWSRRHTAESIKADIERQSGVYKWHFVYIGANQDAIMEAGNIGIGAGNALNYSANKVGTERLYGAMSANLTELRCGLMPDMAWSDEQKAEQDKAKGK